MDLAALSAAESAKASRQCLRPSSCHTGGLVPPGDSGLVPLGDFVPSRERQRRSTAPREAPLQRTPALLALTNLHLREFCCTFPEPLGRVLEAVSVSCARVERPFRLFPFPLVLQQKGLARAAAEQAGIAFVFSGLEKPGRAAVLQGPGSPRGRPSSDSGCDSPRHKQGLCPSPR